jgi:hypothetical protein
VGGVLPIGYRHLVGAKPDILAEWYLGLDRTTDQKLSGQFIAIGVGGQVWHAFIRDEIQLICNVVYDNAQIVISSHHILGVQVQDFPKKFRPPTERYVGFFYFLSIIERMHRRQGIRTCAAS